MKYVSPKTEKKKKLQKKQTIICGCIFLAIFVGFALVFVLKNLNKSSQYPTTDNNKIENSNEVNTENDIITDSNNSDSVSNSNEISSQKQDKPVNTKPKKSLWKKITSIFSKNKEVKFVYPAMSFGVTIQQPANKIISLSPLATEAILSSTSQNALIAVSEYCDKHGRNELQSVGTPLIPKVDDIIELSPDYLIIQNPINETDRIAIEQSGIKILTVKVPKNLEEFKEMYRSISALTCGAEQATLLSERITLDIQEKINLYSTALQNIEKKSAVMIFNTYGMIATSDTIESNLISNFFNVISDGENYFPTDIKNIISANPQVIIVADTITQEQLVTMGFGETDAVKNGNIFYVPIKEFENISPRVIHSLAGIVNQVYGEQIKPVSLNKDNK